MEELEASSAPPRGGICIEKRAWDNDSTCYYPEALAADKPARPHFTPLDTEAQKLRSGQFDATSHAVLFGGLWGQCWEESGGVG